MKLLQHRKDIKWLGTWIEGSKCDCATCNMFRAVKNRYLNMTLMAEEHLSWIDDNLSAYTLREKRVLKDAEVKK